MVDLGKKLRILKIEKKRKLKRKVEDEDEKKKGNGREEGGKVVMRDFVIKNNNDGEDQRKKIEKKLRIDEKVERIEIERIELRMRKKKEDE